MENATFAAGCFWGVQYYFDQIPGVVGSSVGYANGQTDHPTYEQVCSGQTGYAEAVDLEFDPDVVSYETLVRHFFRVHDPTQVNRQGPDIGTQYRTGVYYHDKQQQTTAQNVRDELQGEYSDPIMTQIEPLKNYHRAEKYHQKFTQKTGRGACHVAYSPL